MIAVPARQATRAGGTVGQPYAGVNFIPLSGIYEFGSSFKPLLLGVGGGGVG
jgi:hypothetical protein